MKGFTNSLSLASSGGEGDVIYAVNNTGAPIIAGQKVWLNKHCLGEEDNHFITGGYNTQNGNFIGIWGTANDEVFGTNGNNKTLFTYNSSDKTWLRTILTATSGKATSVNFNKNTNKYYCNYINSSKGFNNDSGSYSCFEIDKDAFGDVEFFGYIINDELELVYSATGIYKIQQRSDQSLIKELDLTNLGVTIFSVLYDNGILMITTKKDDVAYFLRYSLIKSDYFGYSCELIDSQQSNLLVANSATISYATGLDVGDYLFARMNTAPLVDTYWTNLPFCRLIVYKITDGGLIIANDLPQELNSVAQRDCTVWFDNRTNRLYIGLSDDILLFSFVDGKLVNVNLNINITDFATPVDLGFTFSASDDLSVIYFHYIHTIKYEYSYYSAVGLLRFNAATNDWFADKYSLIADTSLIGFATGNTDEQGRYEVITILPDTLDLTLNVAPDVADNELTFVGGVNDN